jgi:hypothetical protein
LSGKPTKQVAYEAIERHLAEHGDLEALEPHGAKKRFYRETAETSGHNIVAIERECRRIFSNMKAGKSAAAIMCADCSEWLILDLVVSGEGASQHGLNRQKNPIGSNLR